MATKRKQEELFFTAEEAGLSTLRNPPRLPKVCMAVTCLGPEWASPLSAHTARAAPGHCSPQAGLQAPLWSSAWPPAHRYQVACGQGRVTTMHSTCSCNPGLCSANKAGADNPESALVSAEGSPQRRGTPVPSQEHAALHVLQGVCPTGRPSLPGDRDGVFQQSTLLHTGDDHGAMAGSGACTEER